MEGSVEEAAKTKLEGIAKSPKGESELKELEKSFNGKRRKRKVCMFLC